MSVDVEVWVVCDGVGCERRALASTVLATMARSKIQEGGWELARSYEETEKDLCPDCAKKRGLTP